MICPHCGKTTPNAEQCVHCKMPTEFARRAKHLSVGSSENRFDSESAKPIALEYSESIPQDGKKKKAIAVAVLVLSFVAGAGISWVVHDALDQRSENAVILQDDDQANDGFLQTGPEESASEETEPAVTVPVEAKPTEIVSAETEASDTVSSETEMTETVSAETVHKVTVPEDTIPAEILPEDNAEVPVDGDKVEIRFELNLILEPSLVEYSRCLPDPIQCDEVIPFMHDIQGWRFVGWNTKPDGTGIPVPGGAFFDVPIAESITLYAQWEPQNPANTGSKD